MSKMTPTLKELLKMSKADYDRAVSAMSISELLALSGLEIEVERDGATPEENAAITRAVAAFVPKKNQQ